MTFHVARSAMKCSTYRVRVSDTRKEKVYRTGLTLAEAKALKETIGLDLRTAFLIVTIEEEKNVIWDEMDQDQRARRARQQAGDYAIREHDGSYIVEQVETSACYIVTERTCSCPDWNYRASKVEGGRCKHQVIVGNWLCEKGLSFCDTSADNHGNDDETTTLCSRCQDELPADELTVLPETGELVCALCDPATRIFTDEELRPSGPECFRPTGPRVTHYEEDARRLDALFGNQR